MWTAVLRCEGRLVGSGAGYSPEEAVKVARELYEEKVAKQGEGIGPATQP